MSHPLAAALTRIADEVTRTPADERGPLASLALAHLEQLDAGDAETAAVICRALDVPAMRTLRDHRGRIFLIEATDALLDAGFPAALLVPPDALEAWRRSRPWREGRRLSGPRLSALGSLALTAFGSGAVFLSLFAGGLLGGLLWLCGVALFARGTWRIVGGERPARRAFVAYAIVSLAALIRVVR